MRFWDSSAVVPLLVKETRTPELIELLHQDREIAVWWATEVECIAALMRLEREMQIAPDPLRAALSHLGALAAEWHEVVPSREIRESAKRFLRLHPLRTADSLQLAAAVAAAENDLTSLDFVALDARLRDAASRQGFTRILP